MKSKIESERRLFRSHFAHPVIAELAGLKSGHVCLVEPESGLQQRLRIDQAMGEQIQQR
jgi:hypothetical protein